MLGGIAGNRHERLGEPAARDGGQPRGPRSRHAPRSSPRTADINHIHRTGKGFSGTIAASLRWCVSVPS